MKCLSTLLLCLVITTPGRAADGPARAPQQDPAKAPQNQPQKKKQQNKSPVLDPFSADDPFGADPPAKARGGDDPFGGGPPAKRPPIKRPGDEDPFGDSSTTSDDDPFGDSSSADGPSADDPFGDSSADEGAAGDDPFGDDPFGGGSPAGDGDDPFGPGAPAKRKPRDVASPRKPATADVPASLALPESSPVIQRIQRELGSATEIDYLDTPLQDALEDLGYRHNLPILLDRRGLEDFGLDAEVPVTCRLTDVSLRSGLRLMLRELDLTYVLKDEVLQVTTIEAAETMLRSRFFAVSSLLPTDRDGSFLVKLVTSHVDPASWYESGGPGAITLVDHKGTLVVTQTEEVLHQVDRLLSSLAEIAKRHPAP